MIRALVVVLALASAPPASAYVRSRSSSSTPTHWAASCVEVQPDSGGTPDLDDATTFAVVQTSMQAWRAATQSCSYLTLDYVTPAPLEADFDGKNVIKFRTDMWCHPNDAHSKDVCYSSAAAGITTVFFVDKKGASDDGRMLDTDIELNDIDFTFDVVDPATGPTKSPRPGTQIADLENTLVHELGHVQGLDHTCFDAASPSTDLDQNGVRPPDCDDLASLPLAEQATITQATMYNYASPGETQKRSPEPDDIAGICAAYPTVDDPMKCEKANLSGYLGGCAMSGRAPDLGGLALVWVLGLGVSGFRRRRWRA